MLRNLFICISFVIACVVQAQKDTPKSGLIKPLNLDTTLRNLDNINKHSDSMFDAQYDRLRAEQRVQDSINNAKTLDEFMARKREEDKKQVKMLWIRGGAFVLVLAATIFGVVKRRKQQKQG
jgi:hypothetical protein